MRKLKPGDIVYHKVTGKKGVISGKSDRPSKWTVSWEGAGSGEYIEAELYTEEEYEKKSPGPSIS